MNEICIRTLKDGITRVAVDQIMYLEAHRAYTFFYLKSGKRVVSSYSTSRFEAKLPSFWRISKSILINPAYVTAYQNRNGIARKNGFVKLTNGTHFDVARRRLTAVSSQVFAFCFRPCLYGH